MESRQYVEKKEDGVLKRLLHFAGNNEIREDTGRRQKDSHASLDCRTESSYQVVSWNPNLGITGRKSTQAEESL